MTRDDLAECLRVLAAYANRPVDFTQTLDTWAAFFRDTDGGAFADAGVAWMRSHAPGGNLPSPAELATLMRDHQRSLFQAQTGSRTPLQDAARHARTELARDALRLIAQRLAGQIDTPAYLDALLLLDDTYPGAGFGDAARTLDLQLASDRCARADYARRHATAIVVTAPRPVPPAEEPPPTP